MVGFGAEVEEAVCLNKLVALFTAAVVLSLSPLKPITTACGWLGLSGAWHQGGIGGRK